jgi:Putative addiction module component
MTTSADSVLREALSLPDDDRADIAAELLASLDEATDDPETVQTLWGEELEERTKRVLSGQVAEEDWATVRRRIADDLTG